MVATITPTQTLTFTTTINAPVEQVYQSFVDRDNICDWLCYNALLNAEVGQHIFVNWYDTSETGQTHAYGVFTALEDNARVAFTWHDNVYDQPTAVDFAFTQHDGAVEVVLNHTGFREDASTDVIQHYNQMWEGRLENLKAILETGGRASIINRVIIGIIPGELNEETAKRLGVPVTSGTLVTSALPNFSAANAGMQVDDVIVQVDDVNLSEGGSIYDVTGGKKPGDVVTVSWYRGAEKHTAEMTLSGYPVPPIPSKWEEMVGRFADRHNTLETNLDAAFADYTEAAADARTSEDRRTVRQTLGHLILMQRHTLQYFASYAEGPRIIAPFTTNGPWIDSIVDTFETVDALRDELRRTGDEILSVIRNLPESLLERKNYPWWMNFEVEFQAIRFEQEAAYIKEAIAGA